MTTIQTASQPPPLLRLAFVAPAVKSQGSETGFIFQSEPMSGRRIDRPRHIQAPGVSLDSLHDVVNTSTPSIRLIAIVGNTWSGECC